jgi:hypothetical protein
MNRGPVKRYTDIVAVADVKPLAKQAGDRLTRAVDPDVNLRSRSLDDLDLSLDAMAAGADMLRAIRLSRARFG